MKSITIWLALVVLCIAAPKSPGALLTQLSVTELTKTADVVMHGTVLAKTCQRDREGRIYTSVELNVQEIWKGNVSSNRFTIVYAGGILGEERVVSDAQVDYEIGEEVVAFLQLNQRGEGVTLGLIQGKFHVWTDKQSGEKFTHNVFHGRPEAADKPAGKRAATPAPGASGGGLRLNDLKVSVKGGKS